MDIRANKPVKHGPDHLPGGQDPIPGGAGITEIDSTDGAIIVADPTGPTVFLTAFKPEICWATGSFSITGAGGGFIDFAYGAYTNLLDYSTAAEPKPLIDGWYQAVVTVVFTGLEDGDVVTAELANLFIGGGGPPEAFSKFAIARGDDTPPLTAAASLSLPTMPLTTADYYTVVASVSTLSSNSITATADLLVSLVRPGTP